jgi:hypothetical protein
MGRLDFSFPNSPIMDPQLRVVKFDGFAGPGVETSQVRGAAALPKYELACKWKIMENGLVAMGVTPGCLARLAKSDVAGDTTLGLRRACLEPYAYPRMRKCFHHRISPQLDAAPL